MLTEPDVFNEHCPCRQLLKLLAEKWVLLIIHALAGGPLRTAALRRAVGGISENAFRRIADPLGEQLHDPVVHLPLRQGTGSGASDTAASDPGYLGIQHLSWKAVFRYTKSHHAPDFWTRLIDCDVMPEPR